MDREDWGSLAAFAVVAEERSFTRAAARLGVSPSALSHTMRRLEERLKLRLLARSTRSVSTTDAGERLLARLGPALAEVHAAVEDVAQLRERPGGQIRITASRQAARMVLAPVLPAFVKRFPDVVVEVTIEQGLTDIVARRFDAGIRLGESLQKDVVAVPVTGQLRMAVIGTPRYFSHHAVPRTPRDLREHRCINIRLPAAGTLYKWEFEKGTQAVEVSVDGPLTFDDSEFVMKAALSDVGLAYVLEDQVLPLVNAGGLVRVLEDWCPRFPGFFLYYPSRRQVSPALTALIDSIRVPAKPQRRR